MSGIAILSGSVRLSFSRSRVYKVFDAFAWVHSQSRRTDR